MRILNKIEKSILRLSLIFCVCVNLIFAQSQTNINQTVSRESADFWGLTYRTLEVERLEKLPPSEIIELASKNKGDWHLLQNIGQSLLDRDPKVAIKIIESIIPDFTVEIEYFIEPYGRALAETTQPDESGSRIYQLLKLHDEKYDYWKASNVLQLHWVRIIDVAIERAAYLEKLTPEQLNEMSALQIKPEDSEYVAWMKNNIKAHYPNSKIRWDSEPQRKARDASYPLQAELDDPARVPAWLATRSTDKPITETERKRLLKFLQSVDRANFLAYKDKIRDLLISDVLDDIFNHMYENAHQYVLAYFDLKYPASAQDVPAFLDALVQKRPMIPVADVGTWFWPNTHEEITGDKFIAAGLGRTLQLVIRQYPDESMKWLNAADIAPMSDEQKRFVREGFYSGLAWPGKVTLQEEAMQHLDRFATKTPPQQN